MFDVMPRCALMGWTLASSDVPSTQGGGKDFLALEWPADCKAAVNNSKRNSKFGYLEPRLPELRR